MVKKIKIIFFVFILFLVLHSFAGAELIVNEVMSNEPGSSTSLEWIELLNTDTTDIFQLWPYAINADGVPLYFQSEVAAKGDQYIVICQNLLSFESYWGNNSGSWGDDSNENYKLIEKTDNFSLTNLSGTVILYKSGNQISSLSWTDFGNDGVSWERFSADSAEVYLSDDPIGSTPGRINSRTPLPFDLALLAVEVFPTDSGFTELKFTIANVGLNIVTEDSLYLYVDPEQDTVVSYGDLIAKTQIPDIDPGDTIIVVLNFEFDQFYIDLLVQLLPDDRIANNIQLFTASGKNYPPIILSEFLADPASSSNEWIELKNRSDREIDITNWYLCEGDVLYPIASAGYTMQSGEYLVLCRDSLEFVDFYNFIDFTIIEPAGWPSLNNNGDLIKLIDNFGMVADSIAYDSTFGDNYTWGRGEAIGYTNSWGRSTNSGGTPGAENIINYPATASEIKITIDQNPFSPSSGNEMEIQFVLPAGSFTMKLYDIEGRVVKTFMDNHYAYDGSIIWDGKSDGGRRLPVGIYILFAEVVDSGHYKQTIVIAP